MENTTDIKLTHENDVLLKLQTEMLIFLFFAILSFIVSCFDFLCPTLTQGEPTSVYRSSQSDFELSTGSMNNSEDVGSEADAIRLTAPGTPAPPAVLVDDAAGGGEGVGNDQVKNV